MSIDSAITFYEDNGELYISREFESELYGVTKCVVTVEHACRKGTWTCADGTDQKITEKELRVIKRNAESFYG